MIFIRPDKLLADLEKITSFFTALIIKLNSVNDQIK